MADNPTGQSTRPGGIPVNPAVLQWARRTAGFEVDYVAHRIGKSPDLIRAFEAGDAIPTLSILKALAREFRRPLAALLLRQPPERPTPVDFRQARGRDRRALSIITRRQIRRAMLLQSRATDLQAEMGLRPRLRVGSTDRLTDPEGAAVLAREALGVAIAEQSSWRTDYEAYGSWRRALERQNVLVLQMPLAIDELRGFSLSGGGVPTVVVGTEEPRPRSFTLFHELGHVLLGTGGICLPAPGRAVAGPMSAERWCNHFAGAVLVPQAELQAHPQTDLLRRLTGVPPDSMLDPLTAWSHASAQVVWMRLRQARVISAEVSRGKWAQWEGRWSKPPPPRHSGTAPRRSPRYKSRVLEGGAYVSLVLDALDRSVLSYSETLEYLDLRAQDFDPLVSLARSNG